MLREQIPLTLSPQFRDHAVLQRERPLSIRGRTAPYRIVHGTIGTTTVAARSDENGTVSFSFTAGDKLSEYYVSLFAHDKSMKNNILLREMMIALPVTVSVSEPAYLYSGDRYDMQVSLSNTSDTDSEGMLTLYIYDSQEYRESSPVMVKSRPVKVAAGSAVSAVFSVNVPADVDTLGLKVIYQSAAESSENGEKTVPGASDGWPPGPLRHPPAG